MLRPWGARKSCRHRRQKGHKNFKHARPQKGRRILVCFLRYWENLTKSCYPKKLDCLKSGWGEVRLPKIGISCGESLKSKEFLRKVKEIQKNSLDFLKSGFTEMLGQDLLAQDLRTRLAHKPPAQDPAQDFRTRPRTRLPAQGSPLCEQGFFSVQHSKNL